MSAREPSTTTDNILTRILARRRAHVANLKQKYDVPLMRRTALQLRKDLPALTLRAALQTDAVNIIAEYKRASPSKGVIHSDVSVSEMARSYAAGGATAMSVLTEEEHFKGALTDLSAAAAAGALPVLRKDFIVDELQIYEAALNGASAILLIVAALDDEQLTNFRVLAEDELGLDALTEVHTADEMRRAQNCGAKLIGVNNRNLQTFNVTLDTSYELARAVDANSTTLVSESGIRTHADCAALRACGYKGFLIGETLMTAPDAAGKLKELRGYNEALISANGRTADRE